MRKLLFILIFFIFLPLVAIAAPQKIAIAPFAIYAPLEFHYLKDGIYTMFFTRLFWENKVEVLEREIIENTMRQLNIKNVSNIEKAKQLGDTLNVDYVLYGSITIFGKGASIDLNFLDLATKKVYPFFAQCDNLSDLISKIDSLAARINNTIFGRKVVATTPKQPIQSQSTPVKETKISSNKIKLKKWYSYPMPLEAKGLAVGDVNGDGYNEVVLIDDNDIWIYQFKDERLLLIKKKEGSAHIFFVNVDLYDLNNDGKEELLISNVIRKRVMSIIYSWQNGKLEPLAKDIPWYLRVQTYPDGKKVILGQKGGIEVPFKEGIFRLTWNGNGFDIEERVSSLKNVQIYNCIFADLTGDEVEDILMLDEEDYLVLLTKTGNKEWKSGEHYNGSFYYLEGKPIDEDAFNPRLERIYIPGRMLITELDQKPPYEIIFYQNHSRFGRIVKNYKSFKSGELRALVWDGLGMKIKWRSPEINGCITDCTLADFDNDGETELIFTVVRHRKTTLFSKARTIIIAYNLKAIKLKEE